MCKSDKNVACVIAPLLEAMAPRSTLSLSFQQRCGEEGRLMGAQRRDGPLLRGFFHSHKLWLGGHNNDPRLLSHLFPPFCSSVSDSCFSSLPLSSLSCFTQSHYSEFPPPLSLSPVPPIVPLPHYLFLSLFPLQVFDSHTVIMWLLFYFNLTPPFRN